MAQEIGNLLPFMLDGVGSLILHQGKRYVLRSVARDEGIKSKYTWNNLEGVTFSILKNNTQWWKYLMKEVTIKGNY